MADVDLASINLNLLVALDALLREEHVTRAAKRAGISQSAMSHQLAALRELFDDLLLVRGPEGMELTPRARDLQRPLHDALSRVREVFRKAGPFEPGSATGRFGIGTSDSLGAFVLPDLLRRLRHVAPQIEISLVEVNPRDFNRSLGANDVHLTIGPAPKETGLEQSLLFEDPFVCALASHNPACRHPLDLERFLELDHVLISPTGVGASFVDEALGALGLTRRIGLRTTSFLPAPLVVADTDCIVTAPRHCLVRVAKSLGLKLVAPPLDLPSLRISMAWHGRLGADPLHHWMREQIASVLSPISQETGGTN